MLNVIPFKLIVLNEIKMSRNLCMLCHQSGNGIDNVQYFEKNVGLTPQPELKKVVYVSKNKALKIYGMKYILQMFIKKS